MSIQIFITLFLSVLYNIDIPAFKNSVPTASNIIFKTSDGGNAWDDVSAGLPQKFDVWSIFATKGEVLLGYEKGLYCTIVSETAPTWQKEIFFNERIHAISLCQSGPYARSYEKGFFQKMLGTDVWIPVYNTLQKKPVRTILETKRGDIFVGSENGIYKSTDKGKTWRLVYNGGMVTCFISKENVMAAGGQNGVIRTLDGGENWEQVLSGDGPIQSLKIIDGKLVVISFGVVSPYNKSENDLPTSNTIRSSDDGGKTWKHTYPNLAPFRYMYKLEDKPSQGRVINDIEEIDDAIFCSIEKGIYRCDDHGKNWEMVLPSIENTLFDLAVSGNVVYAVKVFRGC